MLEGLRHTLHLISREAHGAGGLVDGDRRLLERHVRLELFKGIQEQLPEGLGSDAHGLLAVDAVPHKVRGVGQDRGVPMDATVVPERAAQVVESFVLGRIAFGRRVLEVPLFVVDPVRRFLRKAALDQFAEDVGIGFHDGAGFAPVLERRHVLLDPVHVLVGQHVDVGRVLVGPDGDDADDGADGQHVSGPEDVVGREAVVAAVIGVVVKTDEVFICIDLVDAGHVPADGLEGPEHLDAFRVVPGLFLFGIAEDGIVRVERDAVGARVVVLAFQRHHVKAQGLVPEDIFLTDIAVRTGELSAARVEADGRFVAGCRRDLRFPFRRGERAQSEGSSHDEHQQQRQDRFIEISRENGCHSNLFLTLNAV